MIAAIIAGKREHSAHIMFWTAVSLVIVITVWPVASVPEMKPAMPNSRATKEPEIAVPNFMAIVPDEKIRPVDEVQLFLVLW